MWNFEGLLLSRIFELLEPFTILINVQPSNNDG